VFCKQVTHVRAGSDVDDDDDMAVDSSTVISRREQGVADAMGC